MYINPDILFTEKNKDAKSSDFFCTVCQFPFATYHDFNIKKEYNCCYDCYIHFAEAKRTDWKNGWRPDKKDVTAHVKTKKQLNSRIITIKEIKKWD